MPLRAQRAANRPCKFGQSLNIFESNLERRIFDQEKPVASPGNIAAHGSESLHSYGYSC